MAGPGSEARPPPRPESRPYYLGAPDPYRDHLRPERYAEYRLAEGGDTSESSILRMPLPLERCRNGDRRRLLSVRVDGGEKQCKEQDQRMRFYAHRSYPVCSMSTRVSCTSCAVIFATMVVIYGLKLLPIDFQLNEAAPFLRIMCSTFAPRDGFAWRTPLHLLLFIVLSSETDIIIIIQHRNKNALLLA